MLSLKRGARLAACGVLVVWGLDCGHETPCYGVSVGDRIEVTIVDTYDSNSTYGWAGQSPTPGCGFGFDVTQGLVLQATVTSSRPEGNTGSCQVAFPEYAPFNGWTWTPTNPTQPAAYAVLDGAYTASNSSCTGYLTARIAPPADRDPFQPSVPGQVPNALLTRDFATNVPGCSNCEYGVFVVNLSKP